MLQWLEHDASPASVAVVWLPMLPTDDAAAACSSATMFRDARVAQFWDPERLTGKTWSTEFQASQGQAVLDSMRADDPYRPFVERWLEDPASMPIWDVAYFYEPGTRWRDRIPSPSAWTKQVAYRGGAAVLGGPDTTAVPAAAQFWSHTSLRKMIDSDWTHEFAAGMQHILPRSQERER